MFMNPTSKLKLASAVLALCTTALPPPYIQSSNQGFLVAAVQSINQGKQDAQVLAKVTVQNLPPEGSMYNAEFAASLINGTVLQPNEIFSFNKIVGPRTLEKGFVVGVSISGNRFVPDVGGGICRTSTALHWAAQQAGMKIIEMHNHTQDVPYADKGTEAAVWWGKLDYKFQNTHNKPIRILSRGENNTIRVLLIEDTGNELHSN